MARFLFRFADYLRVKERLEEQRELEYGKALAVVAREKQKKEEMLNERKNSIAAFRDSVNKGISPFDIQMHNNYLSLLKDNIAKQEKVIKQAEETAEVKRLELLEAVKERKKLERIKENDFEDFKKEEQLKEQKIQDEVVSYRYNR